MEALVRALVLGVLQGVLEWLPVSSEGAVAAVLAVVADRDADAAVRYALFLHAGTALAATAYYRDELAALGRAAAGWRPGSPRSPDAADLAFLGVATVVSGLVGVGAYLALSALFSALAGGLFVAAIGVLLVATGLVQRAAATALGDRTVPGPADAVLVGVLQGLAVLPGVSRSGTTVGALLLRGYDPTAAFRLSFLLSIPAAAGAGALVVLDAGLPAVSPAAAGVALVAAAVVGYATIDALLRVAERVAFWAVCVGLGGLAIAGGLALAA